MPWEFFIVCCWGLPHSTRRRVCCSDFEKRIMEKANEVRNNMDIPSPIMEVAESRIDKKHVYSVLYHADPYPFDKCIEAGLTR